MPQADPSDLYMWQAYGVMEAEQGNMDRARQLFQEGVWADPRSPSTVYVFHAWGALEWQAGNVQTARELFKAAVRVSQAVQPDTSTEACYAILGRVLFTCVWLSRRTPVARLYGWPP